MKFKISVVIVLFAAVYCVQSEEIEHYHPRMFYSRENVPNAELKADFWNEQAQKQLKLHLERKENTNVAKNIIMFLGDGMSIPTLTAARTLLGNENRQLSFEKFPYVGLSKTYCVDGQTADSACSATAYLCGVKANDGTIGVTANVMRKSCAAMADQKNHVSSIAQWAQEEGKATGIVTTTRVTHASPSGTYAHTADRDWECDSDMISDNADTKKCPDIAEQLINQSPGKNFKVILGGGRGKFLPKGQKDEENGEGQRSDSKDLIKQWQEDRQKLGNAKYVWNNKQLQSVDAQKTDYLLGLFENSHCKYHLDIKEERSEDKEPSLAEMVTKAIEVLSQEPKGFFLFVEGGRIDHAHHETKPQKALDETIELSKAVEAALNNTDVADTLIVVTADHAHTMSISGYPKRGNNIFGVAVEKAGDGLPLATLSYANGPARDKHIDKKTGKRKVYTEVVDITNKDFQSPSLVRLTLETHGADDVAVFASGPWAHLFTGNYEQNTIPHMMIHAAKTKGTASITNAKATLLVFTSLLSMLYQIHV